MSRERVSLVGQDHWPVSMARSSPDAKNTHCSIGSFFTSFDVSHREEPWLL
jgi:hypothetical protein